MYGSRCLGVIHKEERILGGAQSLCLSVFREKILISSESNTLYYNGSYYQTFAWLVKE